MLDQSSFAKIQVTVCKQVLPFEQQFPGLFLLSLRPFCETLGVQSLKTLPFEDLLLVSTAFMGISTAQVLELHKQMGTLEDPRMQFSKVHCGHYCCWQLGMWCQFHENMSPHAVYLDTGTSMHIDGAEQSNSDLLCGVDWTLYIILTELPHLHRVTLLKGVLCFLSCAIFA